LSGEMCVHANLPQTIKSPNKCRILETHQISMIVAPFDSQLTVLSNPRHLSTSSDPVAKRFRTRALFSIGQRRTERRLLPNAVKRSRA
jgi:hypothetical protein